VERQMRRCRKQNDYHHSANRSEPSAKWPALKKEYGY
jgi:hypothetical protein